MKRGLKRVKIFILRNFKWIVLFICLIIFLQLLQEAFEKEIMKKDIIGYYFISTYLISDFVTPIAKLITNIGGAFVIIPLTCLLIATIKNRKIGFSILFNLVLITALNLLLKNIVQRPRPTEYRMITETGYSFPSGHSMVSMAFYGFLIYLIYQYVKSKKLKVFLIVLLSLLILMIGTSRIYLGVHYTSDVLAGFVISISYLIIYTSGVKKFVIERERKYEEKKQENN